MKLRPNKIAFIAVLIILTCVSSLVSACTLSTNLPPKISNLKADTLYVYPTGVAELECIASDPEGDAIIFNWSCTDGTFTGNGPIVNWRAPNGYGKFHIMVVVEDSKGRSSKETLTIEVMVDEAQQQDCSTCNRR